MNRIKILCTVLLYFSLYISANAQSYFFFESFEDYIALPKQKGDFQLSTCYSPSNDNSATPDYLHKKGKDKDVKLPKTYYGKTLALDGDAVVGFIAYTENKKTYREYITIKLKQMRIGKDYLVSIDLKSGGNEFSSDDKLNNIGLLFTTKPVIQNGYKRIPLIPQSNFTINKYLFDWKPYLDTLSADSSYKYLTIGNFSDEHNISSDLIYFFLDSIAIKEITNNIKIADYKDPYYKEMTIENTKKCDSLFESGGSGYHEFYVDLGKEKGTFKLKYNMYKVPDKLTIFNNGNIIYSTRDKQGVPSAVSEGREEFVDFDTRVIKVVIEGNNKDTDWKCKISCPE